VFRSSMVRTSRCACGDCWIEVAGEPATSLLCSCDYCKRMTGSPFSWALYFGDEQVGVKQGPLTVNLNRRNGGSSWFCSTCGSTLCWKSTGAWIPGHTGFHGGRVPRPACSAPPGGVGGQHRMPPGAPPAEHAAVAGSPPTER